jgi:hypothetical protein
MAAFFDSVTHESIAAKLGQKKGNFFVTDLHRMNNYCSCFFIGYIHRYPCKGRRPGFNGSRYVPVWYL